MPRIRVNSSASLNDIVIYECKMIDWLSENISPERVAAGQPCCGEGWSLEFDDNASSDTEIVWVIDIDDEKLATLFLLRWS